MRTIPIVEAKAHFSALLAAVEAGEEIAISRHGHVIARLVPNVPRMAVEVFKPFWGGSELDIEAPPDPMPEPVDPWD